MRTSADHGAALGQILELTVLMNADMTESLARDGLTTARAHLLWELQQRGPSTQRVLAQALNVTPRNITRLVDGLAATGFVTREPHPTDRRATLVSFTARGSRIAQQLYEGREQLIELLFAGMSDQQFTGLVEGLSEVLARLKDALPAAKEPRS